jgi:hypothetical protein
MLSLPWSAIWSHPHILLCYIRRKYFFHLLTDLLQPLPHPLHHRLVLVVLAIHFSTHLLHHHLIRLPSLSWRFFLCRRLPWQPIWAKILSGRPLCHACWTHPKPCRARFFSTDACRGSQNDPKPCRGRTLCCVALYHVRFICCTRHIFTSVSTTSCSNLRTQQWSRHAYSCQIWLSFTHLTT